jgi:hypothetical protein
MPEQRPGLLRHFFTILFRSITAFTLPKPYASELSYSIADYSMQLHISAIITALSMPPPCYSLPLHRLALP